MFSILASSRNSWPDPALVQIAAGYVPIKNYNLALATSAISSL